MTDHDLTQIGIEAFGARRRMQQAIAGAYRRYSLLNHRYILFRTCHGQYQPISIIMIKD